MKHCEPDSVRYLTFPEQKKCVHCARFWTPDLEPVPYCPALNAKGIMEEMDKNFEDYWGTQLPYVNQIFKEPLVIQGLKSMTKNAYLLGYKDASQKMLINFLEQQKR